MPQAVMAIRRLTANNALETSASVHSIADRSRRLQVDVTEAQLNHAPIRTHIKIPVQSPILNHPGSLLTSLH